MGIGGAKTDKINNEAEEVKGRGKEQESAGFIDWMFRSRRTGRISLVQFPNLPLIVWFLASAADRLGLVEGQAGNVLRVVAAFRKGHAGCAQWQHRSCSQRRNDEPGASRKNAPGSVLVRRSWL